MGLKIYKVSQNSNTGYDTFDAEIVAAENKEDAKNIMPDWGEGRPFEPSYFGGVWALRYEDLIVEEIGIANEGIKRGVILSSFNAG